MLAATACKPSQSEKSSKKKKKKKRRAAFHQEKSGLLFGFDVQRCRGAEEESKNKKIRNKIGAKKKRSGG